MIEYFKKLYVQVLIGVALGIALGYAEPALATSFKPLGDAFIKAIKVVIMPIIFTTIVVGIATIGDLRRVGTVAIKALIYFEIVSTLALVLGMIVGNVWPIGAGINADPSTFDANAVATYVNSAKSLNFTDFILNIIPTTFVDPFAKGEILQVLFVAVLFGLGLCHFRDHVKPLIVMIDQVSKGLFGMVRIIMYFAPIGAFGAITFTIGKYGIKTLIDLGEVVAAVYLVCIVFMIVVFGTALRLAGLSFWKVVSYFKDEILFVFAATSSESMIPRCMEKLEQLGCSKQVTGLVMPTGFSFNMDGSAIYMTMGVLFIAHATNTDLSWSQQLLILVVTLFTSKGAAGVTGGGFVALAATIPVIGVLPVGGLTLLLGVDRFMSEARAATNLTGNIVATLVVARWTGGIDYARATRLLNGDTREADAHDLVLAPVPALSEASPA